LTKAGGVLRYGCDCRPKNGQIPWPEGANRVCRRERSDPGTWREIEAIRKAWQEVAGKLSKLTRVHPITGQRGMLVRCAAAAPSRAVVWAGNQKRILLRGRPVGRRLGVLATSMIPMILARTEEPSTEAPRFLPNRLCAKKKKRWFEIWKKYKEQWRAGFQLLDSYLRTFNGTKALSSQVLRSCPVFGATVYMKKS